MFGSTLQRLFQENDVDLVLGGRDHYYHRTYPIGPVEETPRRGIVHLAAGGGGATLHPTVQQPYSAFRASVHHYVVLDVGGDRIVGRTIDSDGRGIDAFILDKQSYPSPEEYIALGSLVLEERLQRRLSTRPPVEADRRNCEIEVRLETPTEFQSPVTLRGDWHSSAAWEIQPRRFKVDLRPGHLLSIPIQAEARVRDLYPLPSLLLRLSPATGTQEYGNLPVGFRNDSIRLHPMRVFAEEEADPRDIDQAPLIDGQLTERDWERAFVIERFVTNAGTDVPASQTEIRLMKNDEMLFVGARVEQDPLKLGRSPFTGRDNEDLVLAENIGVHIWNGEGVYRFYISSNGDILDMRWGKSEWSSDVAATTNIAGMGWSAEVAIPLYALSAGSLEDITWRINVSRKDGVTGELSEWIPSFSAEGSEPVEFADLEL